MCIRVKLVGYSLLPLSLSQHASRLQDTIEGLAPDVFSSGLKVDQVGPEETDLGTITRSNFIIREIETESSRLKGRRANWQSTLLSGIPYSAQRTHGSVHFVSIDETEHLHIHFDEWILANFQTERRIGNVINLEKQFARRDQSTDETVRRICMTFFDGELFDYGFCCTADEFFAKNIDQSGGGQRAVGLDASKHLPGFYWANYFSNRLQSRIPKVRQCLNGFESSCLSNGQVLIAKYRPWHWDTPKNLADANAAVGVIGSQYFFGSGANHRTDLFAIDELSG